MITVKNFSAYTINKDGKIFNKKGNEMCQWSDNQGYKQVALHKDGKRHCKRVHRLLWESFNGDIKDGMVINHKDSNKSNNTLDNLEVVTNKENVDHFFKYNSKRKYNVDVFSKSSGEFIGNYTSITKMCKELSLNRKTMYSILKGVKTTNNYPYNFISN